MTGEKPSSSLLAHPAGRPEFCFSIPELDCAGSPVPSSVGLECIFSWKGGVKCKSLGIGQSSPRVLSNSHISKGIPPAISSKVSGSMSGATNSRHHAAVCRMSRIDIKIPYARSLLGLVKGFLNRAKFSPLSLTLQRRSVTSCCDRLKTRHGLISIGRRSRRSPDRNASGHHGF